MADDVRPLHKVNEHLIAAECDKEMVSDLCTK